MPAMPTPLFSRLVPVAAALLAIVAAGPLAAAPVINEMVEAEAT